MFDIISHPLCPFAHQLVLAANLTGLQRGHDYRVTYLPYDHLREMLPSVSPSGDLPVLRLDDETCTTTTGHAAEYIAASSIADIYGDTARERLVIRGGEARAHTALGHLRGAFTARNAEDLEAALGGLFDVMAAEEDAGSDLRLPQMDAIAWASAFRLMADHPALVEHPRLLEMKKLKPMLAQLANDKRVVAAQCPKPDQEFAAFFAMTHSAFPKLTRT